MKQKKEFMTLWAYPDGKKKKVGYAYRTGKGNLCIKADKLLDKAALGRMLSNDGLYIEMPNQTAAKKSTPVPELRKAWN